MENRAAHTQQEYSGVPGRPRASFLETWVAKKLDKLQETVAQCEKAYIKAYEYTAMFLSFLSRNTQEFGTKGVKQIMLIFDLHSREMMNQSDVANIISKAW